VAKEWMKDPEFQATYDEQEDEFALASALIKARGDAEMTQEQVAAAMGTTQAVVVRMESGRGCAPQRAPDLQEPHRLARWNAGMQCIWDRRGRASQKAIVFGSSWPIKKGVFMLTVARPEALETAMVEVARRSGQSVDDYLAAVCADALSLEIDRARLDSSLAGYSGS
jgi:hypothetical protein